MKPIAKSKGQYNAAIDLYEKMLKHDSRNMNDTAIGKRARADFMHCVCGLMKSAFADGMDGKGEPYYIAELKATESQIMRYTAAVLLDSYKDGQDARQTTT